MGGFRRFILFVFSLAGLFALAALVCPWLGLFEVEVRVLESYPAYIMAVEVCAGMTAVWLAFELLRSLFSRRRKEAISVMDVDGGAITVARSAVASQASHIVEELGLGVAKDVSVTAKHGTVTVGLKVTPFESIDVTEEAPGLHEALTCGLSAMVGEHLGAVNVEFLEPQHASSLVALADDEEDEQQDEAVAEQGAEHKPLVDVQVEVPARASQDTGDITIPMHGEKEA